MKNASSPELANAALWIWEKKNINNFLTTPQKSNTFQGLCIQLGWDQSEDRVTE